MRAYRSACRSMPSETLESVLQIIMKRKKMHTQIEVAVAVLNISANVSVRVENKRSNVKKKSRRAQFIGFRKKILSGRLNVTYS